MKIGIDIDGVILDYERVLKTYGDLYDFIELKKDGIVNKSEHYISNRFNWKEEEYIEFVHKYFLELAKKANFIPGAIDVIKMLKEEGHELIIITARGRKIEGTKSVAEEAFKKENLEFDKYYWKQDNKLETAKEEQIDFMIDDNYEICKELSENLVKTIYFRDKDMKKIQQSEYLKEVSNWGEIYRIIKKESVQK